MMLKIDFSDDVPIYQQIRNQIVLGIADGKLQVGEKLPTIRALADEAGINMMTVNKAYQLLKAEGYIKADRRSGAVICEQEKSTHVFSQKSKENLKLLAAEARLSGIPKDVFLSMCNDYYDEKEE